MCSFFLHLIHYIDFYIIWILLNSYSIEKWAEDNNNEHLRRLDKFHVTREIVKAEEKDDIDIPTEIPKIKASDSVIGACETAMRYICPQLLFNGMTRIDHSIKDILEYIDAATIFISNLIFDQNDLKDKVVSGYMRNYDIPFDIISIIKAIYGSIICSNCKQTQNKCNGCDKIEIEQDPFQFDL